MTSHDFTKSMNLVFFFLRTNVLTFSDLYSSSMRFLFKERNIFQRNFSVPVSNAVVSNKVKRDMERISSFIY